MLDELIFLWIFKLEQQTFKCKINNKNTGIKNIKLINNNDIIDAKRAYRLLSPSIFLGYSKLIKENTKLYFIFGFIFLK